MTNNVVPLMIIFDYKFYDSKLFDFRIQTGYGNTFNWKKSNLSNESYCTGNGKSTKFALFLDIINVYTIGINYYYMDLIENYLKYSNETKNNYVNNINLSFGIKL